MGVALEPMDGPGPCLPHVDVAGVQICDGDLTDVVAAIFSRLDAGQGSRVATANLDFLAMSSRDPWLAQDLRMSTVVVADGAPVAWLARRRGAARVRRVAGVDLMSNLCAEAALRRGRVVIYGSTLDIAVNAAAQLEIANSGLEVVRILCPPFRMLTRDEEEREREAIQAARPDLVLVALGCPKQERLIARYYSAAPSAIWVGIGGSLDFFAGRRRRASHAIQRLGLEWTVRLIQEPRRLWRRYLLRDIPFLIRVLPTHLRTREAVRMRATER